MNNCCVDNLKEMHDFIDDTWWYEAFILSSPFILIIPSLNPAAGNRALLKQCVQRAGTIGVNTALNNVTSTKSRPDFVDAVKAIQQMKIYKLMEMCTKHIGFHTLKDRHIGNFWANMATAYKDAFFAK